MDLDKIRADFPILKNTGVIYFDNAATSLTPRQITDKMMEYYNYYRANVHRGLHSLSQRASEEYETAHEKIMKFIRAKSTKEIIATRNTTEGINMVANGLDLKGNVVTSIVEHHSNFLPWLRLKQKRKIDLKLVKPTEEGMLEPENFAEIIDKNTSLVAVTGGSNVLGMTVDLKEIGKIVHDNNSLFLIDGAHYVPHHETDVRKLDADFLAFSGHKMLGPTGVGILYVKEKLIDSLEPLNLGGGTIDDATVNDFKLSKSPERFEAGTQDIAGIIGLGAAVDYLKKIGMENITKHEQNLVGKILSGLEEIDRIKIYGPKDSNKKIGIVSFNVKGMEPHDVSLILDQSKIATRSGHHCAYPLHRSLGVEGSVRASFYVYNTEKEVDMFLETIKKIVKQFS